MGSRSDPPYRCEPPFSAQALFEGLFRSSFLWLTLGWSCRLWHGTLPQAVGGTWVNLDLRALGEPHIPFKLDAMTPHYPMIDGHAVPLSSPAASDGHTVEHTPFCALG
jgi:hypothetical protein